MLMIILISIEIAQFVVIMKLISDLNRANKENKENLLTLSNKFENINNEVKNTIVKQLILPPQDKQYIVLPVEKSRIHGCN